MNDLMRLLALFVLYVFLFAIFKSTYKQVRTLLNRYGEQKKAK